MPKELIQIIEYLRRLNNDLKFDYCTIIVLPTSENFTLLNSNIRSTSDN